MVLVELNGEAAASHGVTVKSKTPAVASMTRRNNFQCKGRYHRIHSAEELRVLWRTGIIYFWGGP